MAGNALGRNRALYALAIMLIVVFSALAIFAATVREPGVTVVGLELESVDIANMQITFLVTLQVHNPNVVGATVQNVQADIYADGSYIGHATRLESATIGANSDATVTATFVLKELPSHIPVDKVRAAGSAQVTVFFSTFEEHFDETREV